MLLDFYVDFCTTISIPIIANSISGKIMNYICYIVNWTKIVHVDVLLGYFCTAVNICYFYILELLRFLKYFLILYRELIKFKFSKKSTIV